MIRFPPLPADTARATESTFGKEHPYLKIGAHLEDVLLNIDITVLESTEPQLANSLWPHSLTTILQYWEDLTDFQMANATRTRLELKYALHLSMNFPGFPPSAFCEFRQRLLMSQAGGNVFQKIVDRFADFVPYPDKRSPSVDMILTHVCTLRQWETVIETMSNTIEALAASHPEWLRSAALPHWYKRYGRTIPAFDNQRNSENIKSMILSVGQDGQYLLNAVQKSGLNTLEQMREIQLTAQIWQSLFRNEGDQLKLFALSCASCPGRSEAIASDHDDERVSNFMKETKGK